MKKIWIYIILLSFFLALLSNCTLTGIGIFKNHPPEAPVAVEPKDGATDVSLSPTLSWKAGDPDGDELTYDIYLGENNSPPIIEKGWESKSYSTSGLKPGTVYYWKVVAKDKYGLKKESSIYSFTTNSPSKPYDLAPPNGATNVSLSPTLSWKAEYPDGDELTYDIYLGENDPPSIVERDLKDSKYVVLGLKPGTVYYWKVVAKDKYGIVTESSIYSFTTSYPPSEPHDLTPPNGATNVSLSLTLSWKAEDPDGDELTYDVYFGEDNPPPLIEKDLKDSKYTVSNLKPSITYYWRVAAKDRYGIVTESSIVKFVTKNIIKWSFETGEMFGSGPAIDNNGVVYIGAEDTYLYAINPDGTLKWKFKTGDLVDSSPAIGPDGTIYVGSYDHYLYAINPDGTLKWKFETSSGIYSSPAIGQDGTIYVGSYDHYLYAINPDGTLKWKFETGYWILSSPAIGEDGTIYVGSADGYLYAIKPDGTLKWKFKTDDCVDSSPAIGSDGTIYVGSDDGYLYAINPDGTLKWKFETGSYVNSSPAIGQDGTIYLGSNDGCLYAINPDGSLKWRFETADDSSEPVIGQDGTIYVGTWNGYFYAINSDGSLKWKFKIDDWIPSIPTIVNDGVVYIGANTVSDGVYYGHLYAIYTDSGGLADTPWPMFHHDPHHTGRQDQD